MSEIFKISQYSPKMISKQITLKTKYHFNNKREFIKPYPTYQLPKADHFEMAMQKYGKTLSINESLLL